MILIADSGSTKTDWRLVKSNGELMSFETIGFNPYFIASGDILNELKASSLNTIKANVTKVFFYGAGCSNQESCAIIFKPFTTFFNHAQIEIDHDMLAAAKATCHNEKGMVGILGTGSNSCLYNGHEIVENIMALGYVFGDYGSGADIGKTFIKAFLEKELPAEIEKKFSEQYRLNSKNILETVYSQPLPNRFLAGFSLFVFDQLDNMYIRKLVESRFELFFEKNISKYSDYQSNTLNLVGSVANIYEEVLKKVAQKYNVKIGKIIKQPIEELVKYHLY